MLATKRREELDDDVVVDRGGGDVGRGDIEELFVTLNESGKAFDLFIIF